LLRSCPSLRVLATSRVTLGVTAEAVLPLTGLSTTGAAVTLFLDRARRVQPALADDPRTRELAAAICRLGDGLPLAIELAAAHARALSLDEVLAGMADQLRFLHTIATTWQNAKILIVPDTAGWYPGMSGAFSMIEPRDKNALSIVYLGTRRSGQILDLDEDLAEYAKTVVAGEAAAMTEGESAERIAAAIAEMEKG